MAEEKDLVVIGAGWAGLAAAKTYLEIHDDANVLLLEAESSIGGVWAQHRLYPGLKSNNMVGTYEYSDFPMDDETWGVGDGEHIPGHVLHEYLTAYARHFGLLERTRLQCRVESAQWEGEGKDGSVGWTLRVNDGRGSATAVIRTRRLVVATGTTSEAVLPTFEGQEAFEAPLFHGKHFLQNARTLDTATSFAVLGGSKSAWDAVYAYASRGIEVDWIIRESGKGPCWMAPPYVTPLKRWLEKLVHTRFLTWMSPCIWGDFDGYGPIRNYLHGTAVGRFLVDCFWNILGRDLLSLNDYDAHPETAKLKPWFPAFWVGSGLSILNYETSFFDLLKSGKVKVHVADITRLSKRTVHLSDGTALHTDGLLCCTGWRHTIPMKFLPAGLDAQLGLPYEQVSEFRDGGEERQPLAAKADEEILSRYPRLKHRPKQNEHAKSANMDSPIPNEHHVSPFNLYRFMVPSSPKLLATHDIAFAGNLMTITTAIIAQTQALWITAYLDGNLPSLFSTRPNSASLGHKSVSSLSEIDLKRSEHLAAIEYETTLHSRFGYWRYPGGHRGKVPDFVFDGLPYVDMLLNDLGLNSRRKRGWLKEISEPYGPGDYKGIMREWRDQNKA